MFGWFKKLLRTSEVISIDLTDETNAIAEVMYSDGETEQFYGELYDWVSLKDGSFPENDVKWKLWDAYRLAELREQGVLKKASDLREKHLRDDENKRIG